MKMIVNGIEMVNANIKAEDGRFENGILTVNGKRYTCSVIGQEDMHPIGLTNNDEGEVLLATVFNDGVDEHLLYWSFDQVAITEVMGEVKVAQ